MPLIPPEVYGDGMSTSTFRFRTPPSLAPTPQRRRTGLRLAVTALAVVGLAGPMTACSSSDGNAAAAEAVAAGTMVIDVRTPEEFAGGHLDGAVNMNLQSPAFASQLAGLDPSADYLVYCRSGNRSAQAVDRMRAAGLTALDGGAVGDMASAGWPTKS